MGLDGCSFVLFGCDTVDIKSVRPFQVAHAEDNVRRCLPVTAVRTVPRRARDFRRTILGWERRSFQEHSTGFWHFDQERTSPTTAT